MGCYITQTGAFLPGSPVSNDAIESFLGSLPGEATVKEQVLGMNGIVSRHYAQDKDQNPTHDVYELATLAVGECLRNEAPAKPPTFLSIGTTYAPLAAPGIASIVHHRLRSHHCLNAPLEISSHAGVCTSAAAALVSGVRAVNTQAHDSVLCVGAEHASEVLKSSAIRPVDDRGEHSQLRNSQWFMSVFLRFMLSDGAGAFALENQPRPNQMNLRVDWSHSTSFAHEAPLCMKLDNRNRLLSQDVAILSKYLFPLGRRFAEAALNKYGERLNNYRVVLPHLSSFFFRRKMERILAELSLDPENPVPYWTNLATAGNTGAASIYIMLDEFLRTQLLQDGERLLLFIPESGQFNFVMLSLTAVQG